MSFKSKLFLLYNLGKDLLAENEAARKAAEAGQLRGPQTGFPSLDKNLGGFLSPGFHVIQGAPGSGKTAFAVQVSASCGFPVNYVTTEMGPVAMFRRLIAYHTQTPLDKLCAVMPTEELEAVIQRTVENLPHFVFVDGASEFIDSEEIKHYASGTKKIVKSSSVLLVIDSLQAWARLCDSNKNARTEYDLVTFAVRCGREAAIAVGCPILAVSHRNRAGQSHGGLFASKGSGDIEYSADTVLELEREHNAPADVGGETPMQLTILKNRNGSAVAVIPLRFCGRLQTFREVGQRK